MHKDSYDDFLEPKPEATGATGKPYQPDESAEPEVQQPTPLPPLRRPTLSPRVSQPAVATTQPARAVPAQEPGSKPKRRGFGCAPWMLWAALLFAIYLLFPIRSNVLVLGADRAIEGTAISRSDTMILLGIQPLTGHVNMLSIPRDLWVPIPGYGENRINAAHAFGEAETPGRGPQLAAQTVATNLGVNVGYYLRVRLEGFASVIDALGGIDVTLDAPAAGYPAGTHHLDGTQALAFVRNRDGDDFFRQQHGQLFIVALVKKMLNPISWLALPSATWQLAQAIDTNIPVWWWPRLAFALMRAILFDGVDAVVLPRIAVTPWLTAGGAQVLLPNWDEILPILRELFGLF
jgi:LCP family protein required for cell wall assembly